MRRLGTGSHPDRTPSLERSRHRRRCQPTSILLDPSSIPVASRFGIEVGWHLCRCLERPKLGVRSGWDPVPTLRASPSQAEQVATRRCDSLACEAGFSPKKPHRYTAAGSNRSARGGEVRRVGTGSHPDRTPNREETEPVSRTVQMR